MELIDCHSHTKLSGHGSSTLEEAVSTAERGGLATYAQTEHLCLPVHLDPEFETSMSADELAYYLDTIDRIKARLAREGSDMEFICGIEADWLDGRSEELKRLCAPFDYVIGSVHFVDEWPFDDPAVADEWELRGVDAIWTRYFELWMDMAASDAPISTFGHPDLVKKFGYMPSFDVREMYAEMADAAAASGRMVEVNTSGWRTVCAEAYPALELLKMFAQAGVDCTVGCDAHGCADIGNGVERAYGLMHEAGYRRVAVPTAQGARRYIEL